MPVHILQDVTEDTAVMQDEIFGPLLPVMSYDDIADAVSFVGRRPKLLGLYYFGEDKEEEEAFVLDRYRRRFRVDNFSEVAPPALTVK